jgi:outer membrane protein
MSNVILLSMMAGLCAIQAFSQTPGAQPAPPPKTGGAEGKIACINFADFREGITEMKTVMEGVTAEFEPKRAEMKAMEEKLERLKNKILSAGSTITPEIRAQWTEELAEEEKVYKRKNEDYSQLGQKRITVATQPVYDKIFKFIAVYCQRNGIVLLIEFGNAVESGTLVWRAPSVDITQDFIKEFNKVNTVGTKTP